MVATIADCPSHDQKEGWSEPHGRQFIHVLSYGSLRILFRGNVDMPAYVYFLLHDYFREGSCKSIWSNLRFKSVGKITTDGLLLLWCLVFVSTVFQD